MSKFPPTNIISLHNFIGIGPSFSEIWPKVFLLALTIVEAPISVYLHSFANKACLIKTFSLKMMFRG